MINQYPIFQVLEKWYDKEVLWWQLHPAVLSLTRLLPRQRPVRPGQVEGASRRRQLQKRAEEHEK